MGRRIPSFLGGSDGEAFSDTVLSLFTVLGVPDEQVEKYRNLRVLPESGDGTLCAYATDTNHPLAPAAKELVEACAPFLKEQGADLLLEAHEGKLTLRGPSDFMDAVALHEAGLRMHQLLVNFRQRSLR